MAPSFGVGFAERRRAALLQRIDELVVNPPLVPILDYYLEQLAEETTR